MYVKKLRGVEEREFLSTHTKEATKNGENVVLVIFIFRIFLDVKACVVFYSTHTTLSLCSLFISLLLVFPSFIQSFSACLNDLVKEFVVGIIIRLEKIKKRERYKLFLSRFFRTLAFNFLLLLYIFFTLFYIVCRHIYVMFI